MATYAAVSTLQELWCRDCPDEDATSILSEYFRFPDFYLDHQDYTYYRGKNPKDQLLYVVIKNDQVEMLKNQMESLIYCQLPKVDELLLKYEEIEEINLKNRDKSLSILRNISKKNQKLLKLKKKKNSLKEKFQQVQRRFLDEKDPLNYITIDFESYEKDHSYLLEVGWTIYCKEKQQFSDRHYILMENRHLRNGDYVVDRKDRFLFGNSVWVTKSETAEDLQDDLDQFQPYVLIAHNLKSDLDYLKKLNVEIQAEDTVDTIELAAHYYDDPHLQTQLGALLDSLDIEHFCLHNAGNDAHYTMELFLKLMGFNPSN